MKKLLMLIVFIAFLSCLYVFLTTPRRNNPIYLTPEDSLKAEKPKQTHEVYACIESINKRNAGIQTLYIPEIAIKLRQKGSVRVNGSMAVEKDKKFRMKVQSVVGQEMDIGSNDTYFWFWSRRMNPPALYYAKHEELGKAMLKTPLNPGWMMESLSIGKIDGKNIEIGKFKNYWVVLQPRISANGEPVTVAILIDPQRSLVMGFYLYNRQGRMIASTEIEEYQNVGGHIIPKTMIIIWYEEGIVMEWELRNPQVNVAIHPNTWAMPDMRQKINMGEG